MTTNHGFGPRLGRLLGVSATVGIGLSLALAPMASANPLTPAVSNADLTAASHVAASQDVAARLGAFFVHMDERTAAGNPQASTKLGPVPAAQAAAKAPRLIGQAQPVYSLNPAFVAGDTSAPVATFVYAATEARSASGQQASVWVTKNRATGAWKLMNIITGSDEAAYPAQGHGDLVFTEPQIHAWYRVHGEQVLPLNDTARTSVGVNGVTLGAYQNMAHARYGDKLPGSAYAKAGKIGGFSPSTAAVGPGGYGYVVPGSLGIAGAAALAGGLLFARKRRASKV